MTGYSDHPESITEIRAKKAANGTLWTPRDALIDVLRDIDNGLKVDALVVCFRSRVDLQDPGTVSFTQACPDVSTAVGIVELAKLRMTKAI